MEWLHRIGRDSPVALAAGEHPLHREPERLSAGSRAFFEGLDPDRSRAVLDLGRAVGSSLQVYGRYARWVRFADVLDHALSPERWTAALRTLPSCQERPYDLVIIWDILDRLAPESRAPLVARIAEMCAPGARLFALIDDAEPRATHLFNHSFAGVERMCCSPTGEPALLYPPLMPAAVGRLLTPFPVVRAFTTGVGFREYVAARRS